MSFHRPKAGGSISAFGGGAGVANRLLWTADGSTSVTDDDARFDGDTFAFGGAQRSGYKGRVIANSGDNTLALEPNGSGNDIAIDVIGARNLSTYLQRIVYGPIAGTTAGLNNNSLIQLLGGNSAGILVGASDAAVYNRIGANNHGAAFSIVKTIQADTGNVGAGLDVIGTWTSGAALLYADGMAMYIRAAVRYAANGNAKRAVLRFGSTIVAQTAGATVVKNGGSSILEARIVRTGATTQRAEGEFRGITFTAADPLITTPGETLANALTVTVEGEGANDNDVVLNSLEIAVGFARN